MRNQNSLFPLKKKKKKKMVILSTTTVIRFLLFFCFCKILKICNNEKYYVIMKNINSHFINMIENEKIIIINIKAEVSNDIKAFK